ncbi:Endoribonuclease Dicer-like protein 3a [Hordeum vulgare]|nr:Endoribonuclease Dicer-like protein 3a [Hordeum vulgare]
MLASQLRSEISYEDSNISSFIILEAITTLRCSENFSMEHLELLGDSMLKYAVSRHLFLKFPDKDEGQLSSSRDDIISNAALYGFGIGHTIQDRMLKLREGPHYLLQLKTPIGCSNSKHHVKWLFPALVDFLQNKGIYFTSVDKRRDKTLLHLAGIEIPEDYYIDLQDIYKSEERLSNGELVRVGMATMASEIVDSSYNEMKKKLSSDDHQLWEWKPLPQINLEYAAVDGYLSYEIYSRFRIVNVRQGQLKIPAPAAMEVVCPSCKTNVRQGQLKIPALALAPAPMEVVCPSCKTTAPIVDEDPCKTTTMAGALYLLLVCYSLETVTSLCTPVTPL